MSWLAAGQFLAVTGPSGSGKTSLLRALLGGPGAGRSGTILADGIDAQRQPVAFQALLGYLSQHDTISPDLRAVEAVRLVARLRGGPADANDTSIEQLLGQLGVPEKRWHAFVSQLSGGELKRVRIAAELATRSPILLMDEPASGLDPENERALMRLLRGLSQQGCTVILVTHSPEQLDLVDRVIRIDRGRIVADEQVNSHSESLFESSPEKPDATTNAASAESQRPQPRERRGFLRDLRKSGQMLWWLLAREWRRARNAWWPRLIVPLVVLPALFAGALHAAVPLAESERWLLGFLAVLSCIWLGSSVCLTAIVDDREVYDHERLLFLRRGPYLISKLVFYGALGVLQTSLFFGWLWLGRSASKPDAMLLGPGFAWLVLLLVNQTAVGMGLAISAVAKFFRSRELANFILPLAMLGQIVFSVVVAGEGSGPLHQEYGRFHWGHCHGRDGCQEPVVYWVPVWGGSLCHDCHNTLQECEYEIQREAKKAEKTDDVKSQQMPTTAPPKPFNQKVRERARQRFEMGANSTVRPSPSLAAIGVSYFTISRHGDILLRGFSYDQKYYEAWHLSVPTSLEEKHLIERSKKYAYHRWQAWGVVCLLFAWLGFCLTAASVLFAAEYANSTARLLKSTLISWKRRLRLTVEAFWPGNASRKKGAR